MKPLVIDASVVLSWFIPDTLTQAALAWRHAGRLIAPDVLLVEGTNVFWKQVRRGALAPALAAGQLRRFRGAPIELVPARTLLDEAYDLATTYDRTVYDSLYVALAVQSDCPFVTADRRLFNALQATSLKGYMRWVEDTA